MKTYKITSWGADISEVEILKKTNSFVTILWNGKERRESSSNYFDSIELAKEAIIYREQLKVDEAKRRLKYCEDRLNEVIEALMEKTTTNSPQTTQPGRQDEPTG